jgi:disulfide bond formation protein DsbB
VDADVFANFLGLLAVAAAVGSVSAVVARTTGARTWVPDAPTALTVAFGVATVATAGSLVFSEVYHFVPCELCWVQRIAMYPLALVLGIATVRRDLDIRRYAVPLAGLGALVSTWHVLVQRVPAMAGTTSCDAAAPCTGIWVEALGLLTIPTMALVGFLAITALLTTARAVR